MNRIHITFRPAMTLGFLAAGARTLYHVVIDAPQLENAGWIVALTGAALCLPTVWVLSYFRTRHASLSPYDALSQGVGVLTMRIYAAVLGLLLVWDAATALRILSNSASYVALNHLSTPWLLLPAALVALYASLKGGNGLGGAAMLWLRIFPFLSAIVIIAQADVWEIHWLAPLLGPGIPTLLRESLSVAGGYSLLIVAMLIDSGEAIDRAHHSHAPRLRTPLFVLAALAFSTAALAISRAMLMPPLTLADSSRMFWLNIMLSNGRSSLALQLPLIILWFSGLLITVAFELFAAYALLVRAVGLSERRSATLCTIAAFALACSSLVGREAAIASLPINYALLAGGPLVLCSIGLWRARRPAHPQATRKAVRVAGVLLAVTLISTGCDMPLQLENQAYAISMGVDRLDDGTFRMTVQVPNIGAEKSGASAEKSEEGGGSASGYSIASARGIHFSEAYDLLQSTLPLSLNLSQLKSIIISESLARDAAFLPLLDEMMRIYRLYAAASVIVVRGEAKAFIEAQEIIFGSRLSVNVSSLLDHYHDNGYIPVATLADVYAGIRSHYSDAVAILAATASGGPGELHPDDRMGDTYPGALPREGDSKNEYMGAALFDQTHMVGELTGMETQMLNFIRGDDLAVSYLSDGTSLQLLPDAPPDIHISLAGERPVIRLSMKFSATPLLQPPDIQRLTADLTQDIQALIHKCQSLGCEPFGFAARVATQFSTSAAFADYHWPLRFPSADVQVAVQVRINRG